MALGIGDNVPLIGWAGRLDAKKRVEDFIAAAALVHAVRPDARFLVIGGQMVKFEAAGGDLLGEAARLTGLLPREAAGAQTVVVQPGDDVRIGRVA